MPETRVVRPPEAAADLFFRWPSPTVPLGAVLACAEGESAALWSSGRLLGTVGPGEHPLTPAALPFLGSLDPASEIPVEIAFVTQREVATRFGGKLGRLIDPFSALAYEPRCFGSAKVRIVDAGRFAANLNPAAAPAEVIDHLKARIVLAVGEAIQSTGATAAEVISGDAMAKAAPAAMQSEGLRAAGIELVAFEQISFNVDPKFRELLEETTRQFEAAKAAARPPVPVSGNQPEPPPGCLDGPPPAHPMPMIMPGGAPPVPSFQAEPPPLEVAPVVQAPPPLAGAGAGVRQPTAQGPELPPPLTGVGAVPPTPSNGGPAAPPPLSSVGPVVPPPLAKGASPTAAPVSAAVNPFLWKGEPQPAGGALKCKACGEPVAAGLKFCGACGTPVPKAACPSCGQELAPNTRFCAGCGNAVGGAASARCKSCKKPLPPNAKFCLECGTFV